ncbi:hypothetical protein V7S43_009133 [Phytophthora oleae]|uniref:Uncharacterized protein n=1 Tax=Phytophthora oleae TaxID=2107226 RepID=A0ABD3FFJ1_9STRA
MEVEYKFGCDQFQCNEVIRRKLLQTKRKMRKAEFLKERGKAVNRTPDVFVLITSGQVEEFGLPR